MAAAKEENRELAEAPITGLLLKLAIPTVIAQLVNLLYNMVDRIYVGRIPEVGTEALAGLGVTFPIVMLVSAASALSGMGGASRAAIAMGKGEHEKAEKYLGNATLVLILLAVVMTVVFQFTKDPILLAFGASEVTLPYASSYLGIYLFGTIFVQISLGLNMFITNQGFARTSMATVCIGAVLNIILDPVFIFGFRMGGAGCGTGNRDQSGRFCNLGTAVPDREEVDPENKTGVYEAGGQDHRLYAGARSLAVYHAVYRESDPAYF